MRKEGFENLILIGQTDGETDLQKQEKTYLASLSEWITKQAMGDMAKVIRSYKSQVIVEIHDRQCPERTRSTVEVTPKSVMERIIRYWFHMKLKLLILFQDTRYIIYTCIPETIKYFLSIMYIYTNIHTYIYVCVCVDACKHLCVKFVIA